MNSRKITNRRKALGTAIAALAMAAAAVPALADGDGNRGQDRIVGSWDVTVTPVDCETGFEFSQFAFHSYLTFGAGGTLIESPGSRSFQPNQRSSGHGYWTDTGRRTYRSLYQALIRFDSVDPMPPERPYVAGVQRFDQSIAMHGRDRWSSDALVQFLNVDGEMVPPSGCAKARAERIR